MWSQTQGWNLPQDPLPHPNPTEGRAPHRAGPLQPSCQLPSPGLAAAVTQVPASRRRCPCGSRGEASAQGTLDTCGFDLCKGFPEKKGLGLGVGCCVQQGLGWGMSRKGVQWNGHPPAGPACSGHGGLHVSPVPPGCEAGNPNASRSCGTSEGRPSSLCSLRRVHQNVPKAVGTRLPGWLRGPLGAWHAPEGEPRPTHASPGCCACARGRSRLSPPPREPRATPLHGQPRTWFPSRPVGMAESPGGRGNGGAGKWTNAGVRDAW